MVTDISKHIITQDYSSYSDEEHLVWETLFRRQTKNALIDRAAPVFMDSINQLEITSTKIPKLSDLTSILKHETDWEIVAVDGLVPDDLFFALLSQRKFPSTCFIRKPEQLDYLQEPDIFHDIFGHVPLLINPVFANYMEAYGRAGLKALHTDSLHYLARLYWYTVEFGLIDTPQGLRTYGAGIVSSYSETLYCLESEKPNRLLFTPERVMRTNYRIDDLQDIYFVINSFEDLFSLLTQDMDSLYSSIRQLPELTPTDIIETDIHYMRQTVSDSKSRHPSPYRRSS